ncbi:histidine phosphatase family protein [Mammaliicoccus lentus]|jgi:broad specificity phosphatase PhoE|uniref:histidine phosphatase family protein n=1 Tax=Mammaliicoccus lentus TaxID=42858 RepID=UPI003517C76D
MKFMKSIGFIAIIFLFSIAVLSACTQQENTSKGSESKDNNKVNIYVVRHGETMLNKTDRVQGWSDAILTPEGEENIVKLGKGLKDTKFDSAYSSDSGRALQTGNLVLKETKENLKLIPTKQFREFNFGSYEGDYNKNMQQDIAKMKGLTFEEYMEDGVDPKDYADSVYKLDKTKSDNDNWKAENYKEIKDRVDKGMNKVIKDAQKNGDKNILIVSHGLTIRAMIDMYSNDVDPSIDIDNGSVTKFVYKDSKLQLTKANNVSYMED